MNRKKLVLMAAVALFSFSNAGAQNLLGRLADRAKQAAENAVGNKIERTIEQAIDNAGTPKNRRGNGSETAPAVRQEIAPSAPVEPVRSAEPAAPVAAQRTLVPVTDPIPGAVSFKFTRGDNNEGKYSIFTRTEDQSRLDSFDEGMALNGNDVMERYSYHDVMLYPKRGEDPVKYEEKRWTESYSAAQELSIMWSALFKDRSDFYVKNDGFKEAGTAVVCGKTCRKYVGTIKTMGGYDLFIMNGSSAEIYTWNGYTMKLVMGGKVVHEVVGFTELVPTFAFTQTLDVNWL